MRRVRFELITMWEIFLDQIIFKFSQKNIYNVLKPFNFIYLINSLTVVYPV